MLTKNNKKYLKKIELLLSKKIIIIWNQQIKQKRKERYLLTGT
jgi:hypothetical protein